jgi:hypothetical protein
VDPEAALEAVVFLEEDEAVEAPSLIARSTVVGRKNAVSKVSANLIRVCNH